VTLSVAGTNFNATSVVQVNGSARATTFLSSTSLAAILPATDFGHSGTLNITVSNPAPGGGTAPALAMTIQDFRLNVQSAAPAITAGQPANFGLMVVPTNTTTAGVVTLSALGLPAGSVATFSPPTVPAGSGATSVALTIATTAHSATAYRGSRRPPLRMNLIFYWLALAIACITCVLQTSKARHPRLLPRYLLVTLLVLAAGSLACGSGGSSSPTPANNSATGTPAGSYPIVVTAASGSGSVSTTVTLVVM
jgi:hypothetical protein